MNETLRRGQCGCGAVRYEVRGDPVFTNNCHCTLCQRQSGAGSAVNAFFEAERVALLAGELTEHELLTGSGKPQIVKRCGRCGTAVWSHYPRLGRQGAAVRVGTLDEPGAFKPDAAIYVAERPPWAALPGGVPAFEGGYNPADVLPPERLARLRALAARAG